MRIDHGSGLAVQLFSVGSAVSVRVNFGINVSGDSMLHFHSVFSMPGHAIMSFLTLVDARSRVGSGNFIVGVASEQRIGTHTRCTQLQGLSANG